MELRPKGSERIGKSAYIGKKFELPRIEMKSISQKLKIISTVERNNSDVRSYPSLTPKKGDLETDVTST